MVLDVGPTLHVQGLDWSGHLGFNTADTAKQAFGWQLRANNSARLANGTQLGGVVTTDFML